MPEFIVTDVDRDEAFATSGASEEGVRRAYMEWLRRENYMTKKEALDYVDENILIWQSVDNPMTTKPNYILSLRLV